MSLRIIFFLVLIFLAGTLVSTAQENVTTVGFQIKPLIPSGLFRTDNVSLNQNDVDYSISQGFGYSGGMVIRRGLNKNFSLETGIGYVLRNFEATMTDNLNGFSSKTSYSIIGYEIPTLGLVYIKLSDEIFMNVAFGTSLDMFPSEVATQAEDTLFRQVSFRNSWLKLSLLANVGWEYRTEEKGIFYVGASFHRPFTYMYRGRLRYDRVTNREEAFLDISGNYLTLDFRYFFHEDPEKKKVRVKKKDRSLWNK